MKHKLSFYLIFTDLLEGDLRVAYSTRSGKSLVISDFCYELLVNNLIEHIPSDILDKLIENKMLIETDEIEIDTIINENVDFLDNRRNNLKMLYEVIQPSANCQLGCYYCGQEHTKTSVSSSAINNIVGRIVGKMHAGNYRKLSIGWFGAEPLMGLQQMRTIHQQLIAELDPETEIFGKVVTNGLSLKKKVFYELVNTLNTKLVEITIDGTAEFHDKHRYLKTGGKSFDIIYDNLKSIVLDPDFDQCGCEISIRCNIDHRNVAGVEALIKLFASDGIHRKVRLYFASIFSWAGNEAQNGSLSKEEFSKRMIEWELLKIEFGYKVPTGLFERKKNLCIAAGGDSEMYDANGNIYNCTEVSYASFYEDKGFKLGNVNSDRDSVFVNKPFNDWFTTVQKTDKFPCHSCRMLPICGGHCPKSWHENHSPCPPFKYNLRKHIELKYILNKFDGDEQKQKLATFCNDLALNQFQRIT